mgnify:CR=1 FL=1
MPMTNTGYETLSGNQILDNIQKAYKNTFGDNFVVAPASINGAFIQYDANMAIEVENAKALLYGSLYNPNQTNGIWLDSICKFNGINRKPATSSIVNCVITGLPGTIIPLGSKALNKNNEEFYTPIDIIIPKEGIITSVFYSILKGPINCDATTINRIAQNISGWDTINNPTNGAIGKNEETDLDLRNRRQYSLAINSAGGLNSIISALNNLAGVNNFTVQENYTPIAKIIFGVTVNPNTVYVSVDASDDLNESIARIMYTKRYCSMQGNTTYTYIDKEYPWVTFDAQWQKAQAVELQVNITIPKLSTYPSNIIPLIKKSIIDNFNGLQPPVPKYRMTDPVAASRFYYAMNLAGVIVVTSITVGIVGQTQSLEVTIPMDRVFVLHENNIIVTLVE